MAYALCNEFRAGLVRSLSHKGIEVVAAEPGHILFTVTETIRGTRGEVIVVAKRVVLKEEADKRWRVALEQIGKVDLKKTARSAGVSPRRHPEQ